MSECESSEIVLWDLHIENVSWEHTDDIKLHTEAPSALKEFIYF